MWQVSNLIFDTLAALYYFLAPEYYLVIPKVILHNHLKLLLMEDRSKERNAPWLSVPQFGDWDQKGGQLPDYSMDFSKIREMRKQNKKDVSRASLGNEDDLINPTATINNTKTEQNDHYLPVQHHSPRTRKSIFSYFNCCVKA